MSGETTDNIQTYLITISQPLYPETVQRFINDDYKQGLSQDYVDMLEYTIKMNKVHIYKDKIFTTLTEEEGDEIVNMWNIPFDKIVNFELDLKDYKFLTVIFNAALYFYVSNNDTQKFIFIFNIFRYFNKMKSSRLVNSYSCTKYYLRNAPCDLTKSQIKEICRKPFYTKGYWNLMTLYTEDRNVFIEHYGTQYFDIKMIVLFINKQYRGHIYVYTSRNTNNDLYFMGIRTDLDSPIENACDNTKYSFATLLIDAVKNYAKSLNRTPVLMVIPMGFMPNYLQSIGAIRTPKTDSDYADELQAWYSEYSEDARKEDEEEEEVMSPEEIEAHSHKYVIPI